ncbi:MAG: DUF1294 domain-containing protein [bacterium]
MKSFLSRIARSPYAANALLWLFLLAVGTYGSTFFDVPPTVCFFIGANFAAFAMFFVDKNAAGTALGRVPEVILYLSLWFGIVGGFSAMSLFRHKTRKMPFQLIAYAILIVQIAIVVYLFRPIFSAQFDR